MIELPCSCMVVEIGSNLRPARIKHQNVLLCCKVTESNNALHRQLTLRDADHSIISARLNNPSNFTVLHTYYKEGRFSVIIKCSGSETQLLVSDVRDLAGLKDIVRVLAKPLTRAYFPHPGALSQSSQQNSTPPQQHRKKAPRTTATPEQFSRPAAASGALSSQQLSVLRHVETGASLFLTGPAGTGKSYLLPHVMSALSLMHPPGTVHLTSTTGIGALSISGVTVHSWSGLGVNALSRDEVEEVRKRASEASAKQS